jgi:hypothetical protein
MIPRRHFLVNILESLLCTTRCFGQEAKPMRKHLIGSEGLALVDMDDPARLGIPMEGYDLNGRAIGPLRQPELTPVLSVSPDAGRMVWWRESSLRNFDGSNPPNLRPLSMLLETDGVRKPREITLTGGFPAALALSSAARIAVLLVNQGSRQLSVVNLATTAQEHDLTELLSSSELAGVERIRLSEPGGYLVASTREEFLLLGLSSHKVLKRIEGRFPSPTPDGTKIAYIDARNRLTLYSMRKGVSEVQFPELLTDGVGAWSPNGKLLLAGVRTQRSEERKLAVLDLAQPSVRMVKGLGDPLGNSIVWINTRFLS